MTFFGLMDKAKHFLEGLRANALLTRVTPNEILDYGTQDPVLDCGLVTVVFREIVCLFHFL
jgi:hypothetical protein